MNSLRVFRSATAGIVLLFSLLALPLSAVAQDEKPLLTIGCVSDFHTEKSLVQTDDPSKVRLRGSVAKVFTKMAREEDLDIVLVGGDCSSEAEVSQEVWMGMKELIASTIRKGFKAGKPTPVLYVTGNHDYELSAKDDNGARLFNSADYYTFPMKQDVGELDKDEYLMETATLGGGTQRVMSAYHYNVYGFDFVALNCGRFCYANSSDYQYSLESVQWVSKKLDEIYKDDPDKTVFFFLHIPFSDSNSLRFPDKGIVRNDAEKLLKSALSKHPNLIMLYGHDHGGDQSYTRRTTAQRITHYDTNGNVIPTLDETHVEGSTSDPANDFCNEHPKFTLYNESLGKYVGISSGNLAPVDTKTHNIIFTRNTTNKTYTCSIDDNSIHNGTSATSFSEGEASPILMYAVDTYTDDKVVAHRTTDLKVGGKYLMARNQGTKGYYVLHCSTVSTGGMTNLKVNTKHSGDSIIISSPQAMECVWNMCAPKEDTYFYIKSARTSKYLNCNDYNLSTLKQQGRCTVTLTKDSIPTFTIATEKAGKESGGGRYLYCGSNGYYSCNSSASEIYLYKVEEVTGDNKVTAVRTGEIIPNERYVILGRNKNDATLWYALTNKDYVKDENSHRMYSVLITPNDTISFTDTPSKSCLWVFSDATPEAGAPSFISSFMGSTRHYLNGIDSGILDTETPNIIQALMIYVYQDRVVFEMKNYNKYGLCDNGITVNKKLATYTSYRKVEIPDGIRDVTLEDAFYETGDDALYDLSGRRVERRKLPGGLYIRNGRKYVVK